MSLFKYTFTVVGGGKKSGKITAKTESAARERLAKEHRILEWNSIAHIPVPKPPIAKVPPAVEIAKPQKRSITKLEKLLFLQSNKCFFCGRVLTQIEASVEHLVAKSKGGSNADDNVVACCVTTNRVFGSMGLKEKLRVILDKKENFVCP